MRKIFKILTRLSVVSAAVVPAVTTTSCNRTLLIKGETALVVYAGKELKKDYIVPGESDLTFSIKSLEKDGTPSWLYFTGNKLNIKNAPSNYKGQRKFRITAVSNIDPSAVGTLDITINILIDENDIASIVTNLAKPADQNKWKQDDILEDLKLMNPDVEETFWDNVIVFGVEANSFFVIPIASEYTGVLYIDDTQVYNVTLKTIDNEYYVFDIKDLCTQTQGYLLINSVKIPRKTIVGVDIDSKTLISIPDHFLYMCSQLANVEFSNCDSLVAIGDDFLYQCGSSLSQIDFPTTLTSVGDRFCFYCDSNIIWDFTKTQLKTIGSSFLQHNANLNSELILPSTVETIGNNFLIACTKFNQNLTLPSSLKSIGDCFMYCVNNYVGIIDFGDLTASIFSGIENTKKILSTSDNTSPAYVEGIGVRGKNVDEIIQLLPDLDEVDAHRKLITVNL